MPSRALVVDANILVRGPADLLVFIHQLVFGGAPGRNHLVQILRGGAHGLQLRLAAALLRGNVEAERLAMPRNRQGLVRFEIAREVFAELAYANFDCFHIVYLVYASYHVSLLSANRFPSPLPPTNKLVSKRNSCIRFVFHIIEEPELVHFA